MKMKKYSDMELITMAQNGDEEAFTALYERYVRLAYFIAYKLCKNEADCEDVVQDSFIQIKNKIQDLRNPDLFKYWLNRIVISKCKNLFRKNKYMTYQDEHFETKTNLVETRTYHLPDVTMKFSSDKDVMNYFINELPLGQKEVVVLHYLQQLSVEETASILKLPEGTVKSRLSYARSALKNKIELYERQNECKLNFRSVDAFISSSLTYAMAKMVLPKSFIPNAWNFKFHFSKKTAAISFSCAAAFCTIIGGAYLYAANEDMEEQKTVNQEKLFPVIVVRDKEIRSAKSGYFTLKTWAHCEQEMQALDDAFLNDVNTLYRAMKKDNSIYYQSLVVEGWVTSFESVYQKNH